MSISKSIRSRTANGLFAAASLLQATPVAAHGFGQRYDLPLPLSLYLFGAAAAVVVSFIIVGLFVRSGAPRAGFDRRVYLIPRGIGRLIEQKRDAVDARVELVGGEGAVENFPANSISNFFTRVDLKRAESKALQGAGSAGPRIVEFEINMNSNYAI